MKHFFATIFLFACSQAPPKSSSLKKACKLHLTQMADDTAKDFQINFKDTAFRSELHLTSKICQSFNYSWVTNQNDTWKIRGTNNVQSDCLPCTPEFRLNNVIYISINSKGNIIIEEGHIVDAKNLDSIYLKYLNQHLKDQNYVTIAIRAEGTPIDVMETTLLKILESNIRSIEKKCGKKICEMTQEERNKTKELYKIKLDLHIAKSGMDL